MQTTTKKRKKKAKDKAVTHKKQKDIMNVENTKAQMRF